MEPEVEYGLREDLRGVLHETEKRVIQDHWLAFVRVRMYLNGPVFYFYDIAKGDRPVYIWSPSPETWEEIKTLNPANSFLARMMYPGEAERHVEEFFDKSE